MINSKKNINKILENLRARYPYVKTQLMHKNPFELLIATILSAQCTDKQVNAVTPKLFEKLSCPEDFANASIDTIETLIRSTGFFHNKAKNIKNCCKMLIQKYNGQVPQTIEELVKLPGVGRKTANVVLGAAFGIPGIVVDTHVSRISQRLGLTKNKNPLKIEQDLMKIMDKKYWNDFSLHLIYFGREICQSRKPKCDICFLYNVCPYLEKTDFKKE